MFKQKFLVLLLASMTSLQAFAHPGEGWREMGGYHMQFFGGYWMMPLFMILIVVAVVWIVKIVVKPNETKTSAIQLQNILKERLAKGEINQQEYETLKKVLT